MSAATERLLVLAGREGDTGAPEPGDDGSTIYAMTRPMSDAIAAAGAAGESLSYLQSADEPATETLILFPARAAMTHVARDIVGQRRRNGTVLAGVMIVLGAAQMVFALVVGQALRALVGAALIGAGVMLWRRRAAA